MSTQPHPLVPHEQAARRYRNRGFRDVEILPDIDPRTERGRQMAALNIMRDPEVRKLLEFTYGLDYCRLRYPEAYRASTDRTGWTGKFGQLLTNLNPFGGKS